MSADRRFIHVTRKTITIRKSTGRKILLILTLGIVATALFLFWISKW